MQIICPHCTTSYDLDPAKFGAAGRMVRCARCRQTWHAYPANTMVAADGHDIDEGWGYQADEEDTAQNNTPHVPSPSIAAEWNEGEDDDFPQHFQLTPQSRLRGWLTLLLTPLKKRLDTPLIARLRGKFPPIPTIPLPRVNLSIACVAMAALSLGLVVWRAEIVRLMPQTGTFFKIAGLGVNLRGLEFDKLKLSSEMVDGKPVLVIEGALTNLTRKAVELPRLRFIVRDVKGNDIYAWNSIMEQTSLGAGDRLAFKSRLASPPADGHEIAVRFFQRRDLAAGGA
ncbi:MAG: zinc-ribbon domain-containing protein [Xanthobacteraceae bacterium]|nr:zinc-ribbon domain-containing protein [Xanthobacteraceae bacterium]